MYNLLHRNQAAFKWMCGGKKVAPWVGVDSCADTKGNESWRWLRADELSTCGWNKKITFLVQRARGCALRSVG